VANDVPPVYIEFKGNIEGIQQSIKAIEGELNKFKSKTKEAGHAGKDMSAKMVAAGAVMASVFQKVAGEVAKFAKETVSKFGEVAGEIRKLQRVIGGTAEDVSRLRFAGKELGIQNDQLIMGYKTLSTHLAKNDEAAKRLGISYRDHNGNLLPMTTIMGNLSDRFSNMEPGVNRTALAVAAFGRAGVNMLPVLAKGRDGLNELYQESDKLGLTMSGKDLEAAKKFTMQQRYLHAAVEGAQVAIGRALMPTLIRMANWIKDHVVPWIQHFVNGLTGKDGLGGALGKTADSAHKWGERIRGLIKFVKDFRYWIGLLGITLGAVFAITKIITYVDSVVTAFATLRAALALLRASWIGVAVAEAAAAIAGAFATGGANIATGAAALATAGVALMGVYAYVQGNKEPDRVDPRQGQGYTDSLLAMGDAMGLPAVKKKIKKVVKDSYDPFAEKAPVAKPLTALQIELNKLQAIRDKIDTIKAKFALAYSYKDSLTFKERIKTIDPFIEQAKMAVSVASLEEKKTRGTQAHHQAVVTLNKAIREQASLQKEANKVMAEAAKNAHSTATATAEVNRQQSMLNTTMTASNSWLAAQVRTAGVTSAQQNSFIEVPVIIDGQTVFRAVQKHSLLNDRRNVSNGLARSGSTIG
jgi:hypothetical protein